MTAPVYYIDTFTSTPFKGNPTAVCILQETAPAHLLHAIAKEINLPVTAFVFTGKQNKRYPIRYFTVTGEIPACGHATLAAAKAMNMTARVFVTMEGIAIHTHFEDDIIYLEYPVYKTMDFEPDDKLMAGLGITQYKKYQHLPGARKRVYRTQ